MPPRKPGSVTAAGILAIIFGSAALLCGFCGFAGQAVQGANFNLNMGAQGGDPKLAEFQARLQKEMEAALNADFPLATAFQVAGTCVSLILGGFILVGGIGLLGMKAWSRTLTLRLCILFIALCLIQAVFQLSSLMPATNRALQEALPKAMDAVPQGGAVPPNFPEMIQTFVYIFFVAIIGFYVFDIIYLTIIVGLLSRRNVRTAFANLGKPGYDDPLSTTPHVPQGREEDEDWKPRASPPPPPKNAGPDWGIKPRDE